jgi:hypothetical protein
MEKPKTISEEAFKAGKAIMAGAGKMTDAQMYQLATAMVVDHFGLSIYMPKPMPTEPSLYSVFKKLPYKEQRERTDQEAIQCRAYEYHKHRIKLENNACVHDLRTWIIPALERMGDDDRVKECRKILGEHELAGKEPAMSWEEIGERYK